jgi:hypothetical protein
MTAESMDAATCASCGEPAGEQQSFCTNCGAPLAKRQTGSGVEGNGGASPTADTEVVPPAPTLIAESAQAPAPTASPEAATAAGTQGRNWQRWALGAGISALVLALALTLALTAWQRERSAHHQTSLELAAAQAEIDSLKTRLVDTRAKLARTQALSARQQVILRRTAAVLAAVDPLLSGADELQQMTGRIQSDRDNFTSSADQLVSDMIDLANAVINDARSAGLDLSYLSSYIDNVNGEIADVRTQADALSSSDASYADASQRFSNKASSFTSAVRALQRELRKLKKQ